MENPRKGNLNTTGDYQGVEQLQESEVGLPNYRRWIASKIYNSYLKHSPQSSSPKILEFGAGTGNLAIHVSNMTPTRVSCVEIDNSLIRLLKDRKFKTFRDLESATNNLGRFDLIYSSNVLEHIEDDFSTLVSLRESLVRSTGILILYLPAHQWLFSDLDRHVGHFRRYSKKQLLELLNRANFSVVEIQYTDTLGVLASLAIKILGYKGTLNIGSVRTMLLYDRLVHPVSKFLDFIGFKKILGCNIMIVARRNS